jgi:nicotinamide mononucleotide transporter
LFEAQLTIGGQHILWREVIGNLFGLASAVGGMRRRVWAWPVGIVGNVLLFTVFLGVAFGNPQGSTLLGQAGRQVFFIVTSVYGWYRWQATRRAGGEGAPAVLPRWATWRERGVLVVGGLLAVAVLTPVFRALGSYDPVWADAWIFVGSMLATYAMARGWVDFWLCWIAVDLVGVPLLLRAHFYPSAVLYAVYAGFVIWGFVVWLRIARVERAAAPAVPVAPAPAPEEGLV